MPDLRVIHSTYPRPTVVQADQARAQLNAGASSNAHKIASCYYLVNFFCETALRPTEFDDNSTQKNATVKLGTRGEKEMSVDWTIFLKEQSLHVWK